MPDLEIEYHPSESLKPYARNARTHSKKQVRQIAKSIETFGFTNPILIDETNTILAGHGRLEAAKSLGMCRIPCVRLENMTAEQRRAYVLADNKLALNAGWDVNRHRVTTHDRRRNLTPIAGASAAPLRSAAPPPAMETALK